MCPSLAESIGVNTDNLLISQPDSAENLLSVVDTLTKSGSVAVIVVDSVCICNLPTSAQIVFVENCPVILSCCQFYV